MSELFIRVARNDHRLVESLVTPGGGVVNLRPAIGRLVVDAPVAAAQPRFAEAARDSGTPLIVDPLTFFLQSDVDPADAWARLPFAEAAPLEPAVWLDPVFTRELVERTVGFELDHGATIVVPPYPLVEDDPAWVDVAMRMMTETRGYLRREGINVPILPVVCLPRPRGAGGATWRQNLDALGDAAAEIGATQIGLAISGVGTPTDSYDTVHAALAAVRRVAARGPAVVAWRQGLLGPASVAAGAVGYETGIGLREQCDIRGLQTARRPRRPGAGRPFARQAGVYVDTLSRSLPRPVATLLAEDRQIRGRLLCPDQACCPDGIKSTLGNPRRHAVLARGRGLAALDGMPSSSWRLNAIAREAEHGALLADLASRALRDAGRRDRVSSVALNALTNVTDFMRQEDDQVA